MTGRIHLRFHRFTKIGQIHNTYIFNKRIFPSWNGLQKSFLLLLFQFLGIKFINSTNTKGNMDDLISPVLWGHAPKSLIARLGIYTDWFRKSVSIYPRSVPDWPYYLASQSLSESDSHRKCITYLSLLIQ